MSEFTYEKEDIKVSLERYEWDNLWWEETGIKDSDRVLVIGDSISCGYRRKISECSGMKLIADGLGTSKGIDNPLYFKLVNYMLENYSNYKYVIVNNGLHGWHLSEDEYEKFYRNFLEMLSEKFDKDKIYIALTTPLQSDERNARVIERNKRAEKLSHEFGFKALDLYSLLESKADLYTPDGVHLVDDGYILIAKKILEYLK